MRSPVYSSRSHSLSHRENTTSLFLVCVTYPTRSTEWRGMSRGSYSQSVRAGVKRSIGVSESLPIRVHRTCHHTQSIAKQICSVLFCSVLFNRNRSLSSCNVTTGTCKLEKRQIHGGSILCGTNADTDTRQTKYICIGR